MKIKKSVFLIFVYVSILVLFSIIISAARLPIVDGDTDTWGTVLNEYLNVSLNESGELRAVNLTVTQKITFTLGEIIDNIIDGWIRITGSLNVTGNIFTSENVTADYFFGDGSQLTNLGGSNTINGTRLTIENITNFDYNYNQTSASGDGESYVTYDTYDTGWLGIYNDDWTNVHLGSNNSTSDSNVTHNLNTSLSDLSVRVLISTDGTDANSFEVNWASYRSGSTGLLQWGLTHFQVDNNNLIIQTGADGIDYTDNSGVHQAIDNEDWYYKIKVSKIYKSSNATNILSEVGDNIYLQNISKNFGIGTTTPSSKLDVTGNITANYFFGDGSQLSNLPAGGNLSFNESHTDDLYAGIEWAYNQTTAAGGSDAYYRTYDTGWIARSDWTNVHLGSDTTKNVSSNVTHGFNAPLSNLTVRVLISTDGTDTNSFEITGITYATGTYGIMVDAVDNNNIIIQTGDTGLVKLSDIGGLPGITNEAYYYKVVVTQTIRLNTTPLFGGTPANTISAFYQATCPNGWILADGSSGTPDLRGIFIRGAGTSGVVKYANETLGYFSATYGTYQNDSFQGHWHNMYRTSGTGSSNIPDFSATATTSKIAFPGIEAQEAITDGTHGTPRTGAETRPASFGLIYCMKTTEDSVTSNTIFQESGGIISTANSSHQVDVNIRNYDTGWLGINADDWTNVHLGSDNSTSTSNVTHNLNAPLSDILVKILVSTDGTDANSFEATTDADGSAAPYTGILPYAVDNNNIKLQTGAGGILYLIDADGTGATIDTEDWYYKIKVFKLG